MTPRRHDDYDSAGALSRKARPAWQVIALIVSILTTAGGALAGAKAVAKEAAKDVVAPVERKLDDHLATVGATRELMTAYVNEERESRRMLSRKIDALCRANPAASCPLGDR